MGTVTAMMTKSSGCEIKIEGHWIPAIESKYDADSGSHYKYFVYLDCLSDEERALFLNPSNPHDSFSTFGYFLVKVEDRVKFDITYRNDESVITRIKKLIETCHMINMTYAVVLPSEMRQIICNINSEKGVVASIVPDEPPYPYMPPIYYLAINGIKLYCDDSLEKNIEIVNFDLSGEPKRFSDWS